MKSIFLMFFVTSLFIPFAIAGQDKNQPDWYQNDDHNFLPLGNVTRDQILTLKVFNYNYVEYVPKADPVQAIHNYPGNIELKVFFGDWCTDSKKHVPGVLKTLEFADNKNIQVNYINVSRDKKEPQDVIAPFNITSVPTIVVLSEGKEVGRIVESPKVTIDADLAEVLSHTAAVP